MYYRISFSPDGNYVLVSTIEKPFSYLVPYRRFPSSTTIYTKDAKKVKTDFGSTADRRSSERIYGYQKRYEKYQLAQRSAFNSLLYAEALDEGDPENEVEYRDEVFQLEAPFDGQTKKYPENESIAFPESSGHQIILRLPMTTGGITETQKHIFSTLLMLLSNLKFISDRNYQDRYSDPGDFVMKRNDFGNLHFSYEKTIMLF